MASESIPPGAYRSDIGPSGTAPTDAAMAACAAAVRRARVLVVGNLNRDLRLAPIAAGPHLLADGETATAQIRETPGGGAANSALALAAHGARVRLVARVGDDATAAGLENTLRRAGVETVLTRDADAPTGTSVALSFIDGHRHFVSHLPTAARLTADDIPPAAFAGMGHLLRADPWFSPPMLFGGHARLFTAARAAGLAVSLDINWDPAWNSGPAALIDERIRALAAVLPLVDVVHANAQELARFTGCPDLDAALARIAGWGCPRAVLHLGAAGAGYADHGHVLRMPAAPARPAGHATGTGDLLSALMIALHHADGIAIADRLGFANRMVAEYMSGNGPLAAAPAADGRAMMADVR